MSYPSSLLRGAIERLSGYIDDLLAERRPRRFVAQSADELRLLKAAARLRGARPGADQPDAAFLADLRRQLASGPPEAEAGRHGKAEEIPPPQAGSRLAASRMSRRRLLAWGSGLVAALGAGFGLGRWGQAPASAGQRSGSGGPLISEAGRWQRIAALDEVPPGQVLRFSAGPLEGHLINTRGRLSAVSAVCTHMGCLLRWQPHERELECPCHGASFELSGRMKYGPASYRDPLPPLPTIETRVEDGQVYVWTV